MSFENTFGIDAHILEQCGDGDYHKSLMTKAGCIICFLDAS